MAIKRFSLLLIIWLVLHFSGCQLHSREEMKPCKFCVGQPVQIKVSGRQAIITSISRRRSEAHKYHIRYEDSQGKLRVAYVYEFELKKVE